MTGVKSQIVAHLRRSEGAGAADVARRLGVSAEFVQSAMDDLEKDGHIVGNGKTGYALSENEKRRCVRHKRLEERRRPLVRW